jgi:hypothetical protein
MKTPGATHFRLSLRGAPWRYLCVLVIRRDLFAHPARDRDLYYIAPWDGFTLFRVQCDNAQFFCNKNVTFTTNSLEIGILVSTAYKERLT